jgi:hypothetical protein
MERFWSGTVDEVDQYVTLRSILLNLQDFATSGRIGNLKTALAKLYESIMAQ